MKSSGWGSQPITARGASYRQQDRRELSKTKGFMRKVNITIISVMAALGTMFIAPQARAAADLVFGLGTAFNGTAPSGSGPWLTADFHTVGSGGTVTLTLTVSPSFQN